MRIDIRKDIPLAPLTTIQLGGIAQEYISCTTNADIIAALEYAKEKNLQIHVLGGGSNTIFSDTGFSGLVIHVQTTGITHEEQDRSAILTAQAGENWDTVVQYAIEHHLTGIECLSGIPGSVGGTPFQNVGAYGQDVSQTIEKVSVITVETMEQQDFSNQECNFGYRTSRFKGVDNGKYIITAVRFRLQKNKTPEIKYPELAAFVSANGEILAGQSNLQQVRNAVLALRKKKSMVLDSQDPNSISCGSFFTNPVISEQEFQNNTAVSKTDIPHFPEKNNCVKLSAGWLIEHAGFQKGMREGNIGISEHHSLALVNHGGTTKELLGFAQQIQCVVKEKFGINLEMEPIVVE
ncbi:MAG TPA: UDP-N-acetylmuramate dehydrogenase [Candidatus Andersenbacteria bacterium]|nr:UDP-N-acetylmuramate dehydrogenase [Candidatus Andersenbacteria bacterium]